MQTLNHSKAHVISQPTMFSSAVPGQSCTEALRGSIRRMLIVAALATAVAAPAWATQLPDVAGSSNTGAASVLAGQDTEGAVDPESVAKAKWRASVRQNPMPGKGCFHASYPDIVWESVECEIGQPRVQPVHVKPNQEEVAGNGNDYVARAKGLITLANGGFTIKGVKSEKGVGVTEYKDAGILGPNEYSVQLNTNDKLTTPACAGHSGCTVWQQFVYVPDYLKKGHAEVFMQYWLLGWGSSCPGGWTQKGADCVANSSYAKAPDLPITDLGEVQLTGTATAGGDDSVTLYYGSDVYSVSANDDVLDISSVWDKAEFNVVGNGGGSRADFNSGSSITVSLFLSDGSTSAPTCVANDGTTGESNNLKLGTCAASTLFSLFGIYPYIEFTESN